MDWQYGYGDRLPLLSFPFEFWLFKSSYAYFDFDIQKDPFVVPGDKNNFTNIIIDWNQADFSVPHSGYFSFGGDHWNLQIGREQASWGNGRTGNLLLSDCPDYYDQIRLATYWKIFKFSTLFFTQPLWERSTNEKLGFTVSENTMDERYKAFIAHRYEFRIFDKATITYTEGCMFAPNSFELRFFNPLLVFHNWYMDEYANPIISFEVEVNPYKWINLYGQFAADQITATVEEDNYGASGTPSALAFIAGIQGNIPIGRGFLEANYEWVYTDPWMYLREFPNDLLVSRRMLSNYLKGRIIIDKPVGYWGGPDIIVNALNVGYRVIGKFYVFSEFMWIINGENNIKTEFPDSPTTDDAEMTTPSGSVHKKTGIIHLHGEITPWTWNKKFLSFTFGTDIYWIRVWNNNNVDGADVSDLQISFFVSYKL